MAGDLVVVIAAITDHGTSAMMSFDTREAEQERLATAVIEIWEKAEPGTKVSKQMWPSCNIY